MFKFFVPTERIINNIATIEGDDVKHIYKVLRLEALDKILINNLMGEDFEGEITQVNKDQVVVKLIKKMESNNESPLNIYLFQGLPKSSKMDLIVQKNTEIGIKEITPIITERVIVRNDLGEFKKGERLQKIALEASKQSKRSLIPKINEPINLKNIFHILEDMDLIVVPYENALNHGIKNMMKNLEPKNIKNVAVIIGPEGGFEESEIKLFIEAGAHIVTLGPRIFRTETAGFVCSSILMYELGDLGGVI